jgi:hypothetical protein
MRRFELEFKPSANCYEESTYVVLIVKTIAATNYLVIIIFISLMLN